MMELRISAIEGNRQRLDGGAMFGNAPRMLWQRWLLPDEQHRIELACRAMLVEGPGFKVLCETGIGAFFAPKLAERYGIQTPETHQLLAHLKKIGISPEEITHVVLSHLHFDHAGGLLPTYAELEQGKKDLNFSKARYYISEGAWQRANTPHARDKASFIPGLNEQLVQSGRLSIIPHGTSSLEIAPQVFSLHYSSGHTPEQMHVLVRGSKNSVLFCGDLIPGIPWLHTPITMGYDRYPELLIDEKEQLTAQAEREGWFLFFTHDPAVAMARCQRNTADGRVVAIDEHKHVSRYIL